MNKKMISLLLASSILVFGCKEDNTAPSISKDEAVAEVNGKLISKATFEILKKEAEQQRRGQAIPTEALLEELIKMELLVQEAEQKKLADSPEMAARLAMVKRSLLSQAAVQDYMKSNPVSDEEIQTEYESKVGAKGSSEFKASHILVKTEDEAINIITELDAGGDFAAIAKTKSTGPSASQGGSLGWFAPGRMVPPFSEAVIALENGKYTKTPVQTQFGWHVILREESREQTPPPLESVKEQLRPLLQRKKLQEHLDILRNQATVEILIPLTEEPAKGETPAESAATTTEPDKTTEPAEQTPDAVAEEATEQAVQTTEPKIEEEKTDAADATAEELKAVPAE